MAESAKKTKRRVKNPETFRERAVKASEDTGKSRRTGSVGRALGRVFSPVRRLLKVVFDRQPFLLLRRPFRLIGYILLPVYLRNSWRELRQVSWPNWSQSRQLTLAVILFAAVFGAIIAGADYGLDKLFRHILLK